MLNFSVTSNNCFNNFPPEISFTACPKIGSPIDLNAWATSKPVLESWLKETKDPMTKINETLQNTSEVIKRLPEFPEIMDKANQALTYLASGQIPQNSNSYNALNTQKTEMTAFRNQSIIGLLVLVIFGLLIF